MSLLTNCPSCGRENRVPIEKVGLTGRCGACRQPLTGGSYHAPAPVDVPESKFDAITRLNSTPVLVDFWADWCAPCRQLAPALEQLAAEMSGRVLVARLDVDAAPMTAAKFGVQSIPTLLLLRSGIEVERITGLVSLEALRERLSRFV
jgi:thioredoxin 2